MAKEQVSVSELTSSISYLLKEGLGMVSVVGEISNYKPHSSGHRYFSLKDDFAQISVVMWKTRILNFLPKDGMKVLITGQISVYPPRGQYQLDCITMQPLGQGSLFIAFEELKQKLQEKGYFDQASKKSIPEMPMKIGVITSPTGAAIRDIFSTIERRMPAASVYFRPAIVQGDDAASDIANAIKELDKKKLDVIICGRGGGSIEDLWAFNTEIVADAIHNCKTPIISAVGHETDFTIADFTADLRAATPTAAAEIASPVLKSDLINFLNDNIYNILSTVKQNIQEHKDEIGNLTKSYGIRRIQDNLNIEKQRLDESIIALKKAITSNLQNIMNHNEHLEKIFRTLYPLNPLNKGFAILKKNNAIINNNYSLSNTNNIEIIRLNERVNVEIKKVEKTN